MFGLVAYAPTVTGTIREFNKVFQKRCRAGGVVDCYSVYSDGGQVQSDFSRTCETSKQPRLPFNKNFPDCAFLLPSRHGECRPVERVGVRHRTPVTLFEHFD